jgi:hypothetical protein
MDIKSFAGWCDWIKNPTNFLVRAAIRPSSAPRVAQQMELSQTVPTLDRLGYFCVFNPTKD